MLCASNAILRHPSFPKTLIPDYELNDDGLFMLKLRKGRGAVDVVCEKANG